MDSYVLAETFKYLYLLFEEEENLVLDVSQYVFTTEAHLLPLSLAKYSSHKNNKVPAYLLTCLPAYLPTCLPACLLTLN